MVVAKAPRNPAQFFKAVPRPTGRQLMHVLLWIGVFLAPMGVALLLSTLYPSLRHGMPGAMVFLPALVIGLVGVVTVGLRLTWLDLAQTRRGDVAVLGSREDAWYVGVSFTAGNWILYGDSSWDRGWLTIEEGCLCLTSHVSSFRLPLDHIRSSSVRQMGFLNLSHLLIEWGASPGEKEFINIEDRSATNKLESAARMNQLLEILRQQPDHPAAATVARPPRSSHFGVMGKSVTLTAMDFLVSALIYLPIGVLLTAVEMLVRTWLHVGGSPNSGAGFAFLIIWLAGHRATKRARYDVPDKKVRVFQPIASLRGRFQRKDRGGGGFKVAVPPCRVIDRFKNTEARSQIDSLRLCEGNFHAGLANMGFKVAVPRKSKNFPTGKLSAL